MKLRLILMTIMTALGTLHAGTLLVVLSNPSQTGAPGDVLPFFGTMTNVSDTDTVFLNAATSTAASSDLAIDLVPFFINAPLSLGPLEVSGLFEIFDVTIDPAAPDELIPGSTVSIQGGADSFTFDDLADPSFDVTVQAPLTAAPEPSAAWLVIAGAVAFAILTRNYNGRARA
jgi:hypothetical protein